MYSRMLRQFSKRSLISISSESSKTNLLIKVLYRPIWLNLCRRNFLFHALNVSACFQQQCNFLSTQVIRHEIFQLCQCQCICVWAHSRIESSHSLRQNEATFRTHPLSTLHVQMPNVQKIDAYNFRHKISVGISMKLFFLSHKCINE